jgi:hypothetical protein
VLRAREGGCAEGGCWSRDLAARCTIRSKKKKKKKKKNRTNAQTCKSTNAQMHKHTNAQTHKSTNAQTHKSTNAQTHKRTNAQMRERANAHTYMHTRQSISFFFLDIRGGEQLRERRIGIIGKSFRRKLRTIGILAWTCLIHIWKGIGVIQRLREI